MTAPEPSAAPLRGVAPSARGPAGLLAAAWGLLVGAGALAQTGAEPRGTSSASAPSHARGAAVAMALPDAPEDLMEFLEFLGGFETAEGDWLDPTLLEGESNPAPEGAAGPPDEPGAVTR